MVATAGLLPFEISGLIDSPSAAKVALLSLNLAILVWLVWAKHLFGLRGGTASLEVATDWPAVLARTTSTDASGRLATRPGGLAEPPPTGRP